MKQIGTLHHFDRLFACCSYDLGSSVSSFHRRQSLLQIFAEKHLALDGVGKDGLELRARRRMQLEQLLLSAAQPVVELLVLGVVRGTRLVRPERLFVRPGILHSTPVWSSHR